MGSNYTESEETRKRIEEDSEEEEEIEVDWGDWKEDDKEDEDDGLESGFLCLFCDAKYSSCDELFEHCRLSHYFDFDSIRTGLSLDFYASFKLINYVRSQVAENRCWSCGLTCQSNQDLQNHLHETTNFKDIKLLWDDEKYLKPFMQEDELLYSFGDGEEGEQDFDTSFDREELMRDLGNFQGICIDDETTKEKSASNTCTADEKGKEEVGSTFNGLLNMASSSQKMIVDSMDSREHIGAFDKKPKDKDLRVSLVNLSAKDIKRVNEDYFGSYSSFGIHREMISDKVRTDTYRQAILENPSLMKGAVVMDVGCGTGILSLFSAQGGASRVIAVEASEKMAAVATQIAKDNGLWCNTSLSGGSDLSTGVIEVAQCMVEELAKSVQIQPHSIDILVSEWMGYCLLYESMLSSVLFARDQWLKPGGAILPDTATMFVAGFGRGGTSLPFWENVYGFNMSCVGRELVQDAARIPVVDVVDDHDLVTNAAVLQTFDLATMKSDEVDFTATVELEPKLGSSTSKSELKSTTTWCYGIVLWFETGFTSRFCKEKPVVLSTSPYTPKTHWSQTIITFREPIALASGNFSANGPATVGTVACPATRLHLRISIARAVEHRSIDISLETAGVGSDGHKHSWPVQIFNLS
ncbi:Arginine N-methyltransferase family protein [Melia azedarach]|uniref:Arginine N-methyltransferase family protein n=1 Tax=Melia azedarach TaxID=155640 RepID=A0ACC1Y9I6_MELAZ|nr:Arginine N-methyltransferase family protein [Melia azedarach]